MITRGKAVILMYYGFPEKREEMRDYLRGILHGKEPPESLIKENLMKLDMVGGETPSTRIVNSIRDKVEARLGEQGYNIYLLSKHYRPSINEASRLVTESEIFEVPLFPVYSRFIFEGYFGTLERQFEGRKMVRVTDIGSDNGLINFYRENIEESENSILTFSAHSIPLEGYDPYSESVQKLSRTIAGDRKFINIYHSQGPFRPTWLTPYPEHAISYAKENGYRKIQVVPVGFIYEHLEVLYDLDYKLRNDAMQAGIQYERVPLPNDSDIVIDAIENLVRKSGR